MLACATSLSHATDFRNVLTDFHITSWGPKEGLPGTGIRAIAQDREGYLWLGTEIGLVRFDGVTFILWDEFWAGDLPRREVTAMLVSRDGTLWVGYGGEGGITRLTNLNDASGGQVTIFGDGAGLRAAPTTGLAEDRDGTIWASTRLGLYRLAGSHWQRDETPDLGERPVETVYVDPRGHLLISTAAGIFERRPGDEVFHLVSMPPVRPGRGIGKSEPVRSISVDAAGRMWFTDPKYGFAGITGRHVVLPDTETGRGGRLFHDSTGHLWVGTRGQGLWRVRYNPESDTLSEEYATALTGLFGDGVLSIIEDRDGNIWAGTLDGLNRLTEHEARPLTNLGLVRGLENANGEPWVLSADALMNMTGVDRASPEPADEVRGEIRAVHADEQATLWFEMGRRIHRIPAGGRAAGAVAGPALPEDIDLMTSDRRGGLWLHAPARGILHWRDGEVRDGPQMPPDVSSQRLVWMESLRNGQLWLSFERGALVAVDPDGRLNDYREDDGLDADVYRTIHEGRDGVVWLGGARGLTRFANGRFSTLRTLNTYSLVALTAIVEDYRGELWIGTRSGIVRLNPEEFEKAISAPTRPLRYKLYEEDHGLAGNPRWYGGRGAVRASDGRLWFVTSRGVTVVDPGDPLEEDPPEPLRIGAAVVDGERIAPHPERVLGPGVRTLAIDYSALTLTAPLLTHFRYRLEGFDPEWVEAGTRRQAAYTNLPPGDYRFLVTASSIEGAWAESVSWPFSIRPMFHQTAQFFVACGLLVAFGVGAAWRLHVRRVRHDFGLLLRERARLSRELHDTLLQGLFGVALRCDVIANEVGPTVPGVQKRLLGVRKDVEEYIRDARMSIRNLRSPKLERQGLAETLRENATHAAEAAGVALVFEGTDIDVPCPPEVEEHLLRIGQEAITNAIRHAAPRSIRVHLGLEHETVVLRVSDDGIGFDPATESGGDHYGLAGMKERAADVRGVVLVTSQFGIGTTVEARMPSA